METCIAERDAMCCRPPLSGAMALPGPVSDKSLEELEDELMLDAFQLMLDLIGIFEPTPFADLSNTAISLSRENWFDAGMSVLGVIPYVGDLGKIAKLERYIKSIESAVDLAKHSSKFEARFRPLARNLRNMLDKLASVDLPSEWKAPLLSIRKKLDTLLGSPGMWKGVRAGQKLPEGIVDHYMKAIGKNRAPPGVRQRAETAITYFAEYVTGGKVLKVGDEGTEVLGVITGYLKGIDLSKPVAIRELKAGDTVIQHSGRSMGQWFSVVGTAAGNLGISGAGRTLKRYKVSKNMTVLESRAASTVDVWTPGRSFDVGPERAASPGLAGKGSGVSEHPAVKGGQMVGGGGKQFVIPVKGTDAVNYSRWLDEIPTGR